MTRTFIAIALPPSITGAIRDIQKQFQAIGSDVKWVKPDNCHITLKFLGDISDEQLKQTTQAMTDSCNLKGFTIVVEGLGAFPSILKPNIIWLGVRDESGTLTRLARQIEERFAVFGFPQEQRAFTPHITIGRSKLATAGLRAALQQATLPPALKMDVPTVTLFQSTLSSTGPTYQVLAEFPLK